MGREEPLSPGGSTCDCLGREERQRGANGAQVGPAPSKPHLTLGIEKPDDWTIMAAPPNGGVYSCAGAASGATGAGAAS